ncbi:MAG: hypothetical protein WC558_05625 [Patulibacter sp.]
MDSRPTTPSAPGDRPAGGAARSRMHRRWPRAAWRIAVPPQLRRDVDLARVDYADAYRVTQTSGAHSAERWLHTMFEEAPVPIMRLTRMAWRLFGAQLAPDPSPGHVFGCPVEINDHRSARMVVVWRVGLQARVVAQIDEQETVFATFVQLDTPAGRGAWLIAAPVHRRLMAAGFSLAAWRLRRSAATEAAGA